MPTGGVAKASDGDWGAAEVQLREAEKLYTGDFLEEDLYQDWTVDCREAARRRRSEVSRLLARAASQRGDEEAVSRHLRRLLERDPYDEDAWIALVGAQSRLTPLRRGTPAARDLFAADGGAGGRARGARSDRHGASVKAWTG